MRVEDEDFRDVKRLLKISDDSLLRLKIRFVGRQIWNIEPELTEEEARSTGCSNTRLHTVVQAIMTGSDYESTDEALVMPFFSLLLMIKTVCIWRTSSE